MRRLNTRWLWWFLAAAVAGAIAWSFVPEPVSVETARVGRGPLRVTVDDDGRTRVKDRYTVSTPVAGYLTRIALRPGAMVHSGDVVATVLPSPPTLLDVRSRTQLEARLESVVDVLRQAHLRAVGARATLDEASRELDRHRQLERDRLITQQDLDAAETRRAVAAADLDTAMAGVDAAQHDVEAARAALLATGVKPASGRATAVRAPRDGSVLRVFEESERSLAAGTPLLEIGAPNALEIVADLLSTDAVQVRPGAPVLIDRWGGEGTLGGRVRLVEPSSFTKISALGVEEQRANVIIDFTDPSERWRRLGDGFAVDVRIVTWEASDAVKVPVSALFRRGADWSVFKVVGGRAVEQRIRIGRRNDVEALVEEGLAAGDPVIVHPSERVSNGTRVQVR